MNINKTIEQIPIELKTIIHNYRMAIATAYEKNEFDLDISIKVKIKGNSEKVAISPSLEFFPEPKVKSENYTVSVEERQLGLPLKSIGGSRE